MGIVLSGLAFAACGGVPGGGSTATRDCGAIHQGAGGARGDANAEPCFWNAYTKCQPATLEYTFMGVDAGSTHTFTTQPAAFGTCSLSDTVLSYVVPTNRQDTRTYTCSSLKQQQGGLLFVGCGAEGDVFVPPPTGP